MRNMCHTGQREELKSSMATGLESGSPCPGTPLFLLQPQPSPGTEQSTEPHGCSHTFLSPTPREHSPVLRIPYATATNPHRPLPQGHSPTEKQPTPVSRRGQGQAARWVCGLPGVEVSTQVCSRAPMACRCIEERLATASLGTLAAGLRDQGRLPLRTALGPNLRARKKAEPARPQHPPSAVPRRRSTELSLLPQT